MALAQLEPVAQAQDEAEARAGHKGKRRRSVAVLRNQAEMGSMEESDPAVGQVESEETAAEEFRSTT